MLKLAREKKDFRGILAIAALTEPQEFTPKLHMIVEQQLTEAIDRLKAEFEDEPDLYERILQAIVDGPRAREPSERSSGVMGSGFAEAVAPDFTGAVIAAIRPSAGDQRRRDQCDG